MFEVVQNNQWNMYGLLWLWFCCGCGYIFSYHQISNISYTLVGNKIVDNSDVFEASSTLRCSWNLACWRCSNYIFILNFTPGFNRLHKDNCKTGRETFKFWDVVWLILEILQYYWIHMYIDSYSSGLLYLALGVIWLPQCHASEGTLKNMGKISPDIDNMGNHAIALVLV